MSRPDGTRAGGSCEDVTFLLLHTTWSLQVGWEGMVLAWDTAPSVMHEGE